MLGNKIYGFLKVFSSTCKLHSESDFPSPDSLNSVFYFNFEIFRFIEGEFVKKLSR